MMKILYMVFCVAVFLSGCAQTGESEMEIVQTPDVEIETSIFESYKGEESPRFVSMGRWADIPGSNDDWLFYMKKDELWKCKPDLSQDTCIVGFHTGRFLLEP